MDRTHTRFRNDDRAVSITVTHVITLGITAVLISGLMLGAGSLLESETERSAEGSLKTIGERLSGELSDADRLATEDDDKVTLRTSHPQRVASSTYTVELYDECDEPDAWMIREYEDENENEIKDSCLKLSADNEDVTVFVPVSANVAEDSEARGGSIEIVSTGDEGVSIQNV
ncbi:DUF7266 family protein [Natrononativus amylolyticus]|uniref:DUF7266 family protein n=1 Tax=Natrononativus amylolyticus TaxID=2963434 RepID=UPI0020CC7EDF|nr:hypothetical protein [Natrononativus amylolyticus]